MKLNSEAVPAGGGAAGTNSFKGEVGGRQRSEVSYLLGAGPMHLAIIKEGGHPCGLI